MMDGITVLNTMVVNNGMGWVYCSVLGFMATLIFLLLAIFIGLFLENNFNAINAVSSSIVILISILLGIFVTFNQHSEEIKHEDYNVYQVTIDDNVGLTEFNGVYDIIRQEGSIYTIKEKDIDNE